MRSCTPRANPSPPTGRIRRALRAPDELIAISAPGGPERYAVLGAVPDVSPAALRSADKLYTADIIETYLQLPADLPPELAAYAAEITAGAETPYDKALAIEAALRKLPYTLDVPPPPKDREVVSWFLNDLGKGYCDYFASAMVVLARLSGVPARLAIGYASGNYDRQADQYTVTEMDAHSWAEVYFPGFGWIPFEPTPSRVVPDRTSLAAGPYSMTPPDLEFADLDSGLATLRQLGEAQAAAAAARRVDQAPLGFALSLAGSRRGGCPEMAPRRAAGGRHHRRLPAAGALGRPAWETRAGSRHAARICLRRGGRSGSCRRRRAPRSCARRPGRCAGPGRRLAAGRELRGVPLRASAGPGFAARRRKPALGDRCGRRCAGSGWRGGGGRLRARLRCLLRRNDIAVPDAQVGSFVHRPDARRR